MIIASIRSHETTSLNGYARSAGSKNYFKVMFKENLPWGTKIKLVYGFENPATSAWEESGEEMMEATAPGIWQVVIDSAHGQNLKNLSFVFKITLPDGKSYFDNGGKSPMGHYSCMVNAAEYDAGTVEVLKIKSI